MNPPDVKIHHPPSPDGHVEINIDNISDLSIKDGELHWKRKRIKTDSPLRLTNWQAISGVLIVIGTVSSPIVSYLSGLEVVCKATANKALLCPLPASGSSSVPEKSKSVALCASSGS